MIELEWTATDPNSARPVSNSISATSFHVSVSGFQASTFAQQLLIIVMMMMMVMILTSFHVSVSGFQASTFAHIMIKAVAI